jgi:hypothetical protein
LILETKAKTVVILAHFYNWPKTLTTNFVQPEEIHNAKIINVEIK